MVVISLPEDVHAAVRSLPDKQRVEWLRRVVSEAARKELMQGES